MTNDQIDEEIAVAFNRIADIVQKSGRGIFIASYIQENPEPMDGADKMSITYRGMSYLELSSAMIQLCNFV